MKIISGTFKGRNILGYDLDGTRPTMSRVKESVFAILQEEIPHSICLDLFAGSGNLGIEAISQGAKYCYFNDVNRKATDIIRKNVQQFNISQSCCILNMDYEKALNTLANKKIDLIFLDPPYQTDYIKRCLQLIEQNHILNHGGLVICESDDLSKVIYSDQFTLVKCKKYGNKGVVILKKT